MSLWSTWSAAANVTSPVVSSFGVDDLVNDEVTIDAGIRVLTPPLSPAGVVPQPPSEDDVDHDHDGQCDRSGHFQAFPSAEATSRAAAPPAEFAAGVDRAECPNSSSCVGPTARGGGNAPVVVSSPTPAQDSGPVSPGRESLTNGSASVCGDDGDDDAFDADAGEVLSSTSSLGSMLQGVGDFDDLRGSPYPEEMVSEASAVLTPTRGGSVVGSPSSGARGLAPSTPPSSPVSPFRVFADSLSPLNLSSSNCGSDRGGDIGGDTDAGGDRVSLLLRSIEEQNEIRRIDDCRDDSDPNGTDVTAVAGDLFGADGSVVHAGGGGGGGADTTSPGGFASRVRGIGVADENSAVGGQVWWNGQRSPESQRLRDTLDSTWPPGSFILPMAMRDFHGGVGCGGDEGGAAEPLRHSERLVSVHRINPVATATAAAASPTAETYLHNGGTPAFPSEESRAGQIGGAGAGGINLAKTKSAHPKRPSKRLKNAEKKDNSQGAMTTKTNKKMRIAAKPIKNTKATARKKAVLSGLGRNKDVGGEELAHLAPTVAPSFSYSSGAAAAAAASAGLESAAAACTTADVVPPLPKMGMRASVSSCGSDITSSAGSRTDEGISRSSICREPSAPVLRINSDGPAVAGRFVVQEEVGGRSGKIEGASGGNRGTGGQGGGTHPSSSREVAAAATAVFGGARWNNVDIGRGGSGGIADNPTSSAREGAGTAAKADVIIVEASSPTPPVRLSQLCGGQTTVMTTTTTTHTSKIISDAGRGSGAQGIERSPDRGAARAPALTPAAKTDVARSKVRGRPPFALMLQSFSLSPLSSPVRRQRGVPATGAPMTPTPDRGVRSAGPGARAGVAKKAVACTPASSSSRRGGVADAAPPSASTAVDRLAAGQQLQQQHAVVRLQARPDRKGRAASEPVFVDRFATEKIAVKASTDTTAVAGDDGPEGVCGGEKKTSVGAPIRKKRASREFEGDSGSGDGDSDGRGSARPASSSDPAPRPGRAGAWSRPAGKALAEEMLETPVVECDVGGSGGGAIKTASVDHMKGVVVDGRVRTSSGKRGKAGVMPTNATGVPRRKVKTSSMAAAARGVSDPEKNKRRSSCSCSKCRCLKLYCDCFAESRYCGPACRCVSCHNRQDQAVVVSARREAQKRKPSAFVEKTSDSSVSDGAGCGCTRSRCLKKYCICFQKSVPCGASCSCERCMNTTTVMDGRGRGKTHARSSTAPLLLQGQGHRLDQQQQQQRQHTSKLGLRGGDDEEEHSAHFVDVDGMADVEEGLFVSTPRRSPG